MADATRTLVVWCPDWPLVAAGWPADQPAAVFHANRVTACTAAARAEGVRRGLRRREAQTRCPELAVEVHDPARDVRTFEPIVAAVETFTPGVEVTRAGLCALATRGPSRYFGGDEALAAAVAATVTEVLSTVLAGAPTVRVGVADGPFAAALAARQGTVVAPGESGAFLAPFPITVLDLPELTGLLRRLGLRTLGDFAALPDRDVAARFGPPGSLAHRRAGGLDDRPLEARIPPPDLQASVEFDPPADRVDTAAFAAKTMADDLCQKLATVGLACSGIRIESQTEYGEHLSRVWRHHRAFTPTAVADRVRWQLEGWLAQRTVCGCPAPPPGSTGPPCPGGPACPSPAGGTSGGLTLVRLVPEDVAVDHGRQSGFWGGISAADERAGRGLVRLQGLLGPEAVFTAVIGGGRGPAEQVRLVPWGEPSSGRGPSPTEVPAWPGRVPPPSPALVHRVALPAELWDGDGRPVGVSGRGLLTATPARLSASGGPWTPVEAWAGPWLADERWWDPSARRRRARLQVIVADGSAHLLVLEDGVWRVEATYD